MSINSKKNILVVLEREIKKTEKEIGKGINNAWLLNLTQRKLFNLQKAYIEILSL